jgi:hypothetical protein
MTQTKVEDMPIDALSDLESDPEDINEKEVARFIKKMALSPGGSFGRTQR